jgi:dTDP-4-dehydrorhamnose reductase
MKVLLTGASGQLGQALQERLGDSIVAALDRPELDITEHTAVRQAVAHCRPDLIINAAAYTDVDGAESDREQAYRVNAVGPRNLALASAEHDISLLHVSTDYVFDGEHDRPYHEFDQPNPRSVYGASKLAGEAAVRAHNPRHFIVRTAWLYHVQGRNFPGTMRSLAERKEVRVVTDQYGSPTYAPHLAEALAQLILRQTYGTYHLAGSGGTSWYELACRLYQELGLRTPVRPVPTQEFPRPAPRPRYSVLTTLQSPEIRLPPWEEGLAEYARAVRAY